MSAPDIRLDGRVAIVTGAARGLGRAMARALVAAGADVLFADIDREAAALAAGEAAGLPGAGRTLALSCDITRPDDCRRAVDEAVAAFGALHILVNNAGKGPAHVEASPQTKSMKFWESDPHVWALVIDTNVTGTFYMSRAAAPRLIEAGWGRIVNVTTSLSTMQRRMNSPYGVSKAAIEAETLIWSKDLDGTGVTVNSLIPGGAVDTDFVSAPTRADMAATGRKILQPEVMIAPMLWLASPLSDGISGRRYVGKNWNDRLSPAEAAAGALEPPVLREPIDGR
jgi:NAD(P)-dependent dehydrogenase (short-subunit alcohol dehydrogenase family)